jgi:hypothetical protein
LEWRKKAGVAERHLNKYLSRPAAHPVTDTFIFGDFHGVMPETLREGNRPLTFAFELVQISIKMRGKRLRFVQQRF